MFQHSPLVLCVLAGAVLAGCSDSPVLEPSQPSAHATAPVLNQRHWTLDDEFDRIAREDVPGFAGSYLNSQGDEVVMLTDLRQSAVAERVLGQRAGRDSRGRITFRKARYDFPSLRSWSAQLAVAISSEKTFAIDVDEVRNLLWVGVTSPASIANVRRHANEVGIPGDALLIELFQPPQPRAAVTDWTDSKIGGYQIQTYGWSCTLGFNAILHGQWVFVTASHCSGTKNQLDGVLQYQSTYAAGNEIGYEVADPNTKSCRWWSMPLPKCRRADASAYAYYSQVAAPLGRIARTQWYGANQRGSLEVDGNQPYFQITAKSLSGGQVGTWVDKVGRTSGWTRGQVTSSCVLLSNGDVYYTCQNKTSTWSEPGDSGAPMFIVGSGVTLTGLLWGGPVGNWGETWYSSIGGVEEDFGGTLTVF